MKTSRRGFTLIETATAITMVVVAAALILTEGSDILADSHAKAAEANAATLNFAMAEYRDYLARGYRPDTSWVAQSPQGIFAELRKPLRRGGQTVYALSDAAVDEATAITLVVPRNAANTQADYTPDCVWFPLR